MYMGIVFFLVFSSQKWNATAFTIPFYTIPESIGICSSRKYLLKIRIKTLKNVEKLDGKKKYFGAFNIMTFSLNVVRF